MRVEGKSRIVLVVLSFILLSGLFQGIGQDSLSHASVNSVGSQGTLSSPQATTTVTYVKTFGNIISNTAQQKDVFPEDVQATSDGGYVFLGSTDCTTQACVSAQGGTNNFVSWLVKTDSSGNPLWQQEVGCFSNPPGDYSTGVSLQQTSDGGYIIGGGTIGCGSNTTCPTTSGITCALVEKLDSAGRIVWVYVYLAGVAGSGITQIKQTSDRGYIAVGSATIVVGQPSGALILKLTGQGTVQWQRVLGPTGSTQAGFNAVQQTSDGGYIAVGNLNNPGNALVVKFDSSGKVQWEEGFNLVNTESVIQTSDGGFLVASGWSNSTNGFPGSCCKGASLVKLYPNGSIQWQKAYEGGVYCFFNGYSETCYDIGPFIYAIHQTVDGGYVLAGDSNLKLADSAPIEPWLAKVDSNGNLLWQYLYYQVYAPTGRPLGENFQSATIAQDGGFIALGVTEDYTVGLHLLYAVKTDASGLVGGCSEVNPASSLTSFNPGLAVAAQSLPISTSTTSPVVSPGGVHSTAISTAQDCGSGPPPPPPPSTGDFSISASPTSISIIQGNSGRSTITLTSLNGFSGTIALSTGTLPSGVTASFNPPSVTMASGGTGASIITFRVSTGATPGTYGITFKGTSGSLSHTRTITLTVNSSDNCDSC